MKLKSRFLLLEIFLMLALTMRTANTIATGNANADADAEADADADDDANAAAKIDTNHTIQPYDDPPNHPECGKIKYKEKKIVGGQEAKFASHPWLGLLFAVVSDGVQIGIQICGCNLLSPKWCVTAAHCMYSDKTNDEIPLRNFSVAFGEHNIDSTSEPLPYKEFTFEMRKIHPEYEKHKPRYDITMMKINGTIAYDDHIVPICLPKSNVNIFRRTANVAGWGVYDYSNWTAPDILQEVNVKIITDDKCKKWWQEAGEAYNDHITSFCAGFKRGVKDSCKGDSGGALTVMEGRKHVAVGLVSYGKKCGFRNLPGVYVRVQYFVPWILECMK